MILMIVFNNNVIDLEEAINKAKWDRLTLDFIDMLQKKYKLTEEEAVKQYNNYIQYSFKKFNLKP